MSNVKVCLLTGASRGLGAGILKQLAHLDYPVYVYATAKTDQGVAAVNSLLKQAGLEGRALTLDCSDAHSVATFCDAFSDLQPKGCDVLINNAGLTRDNLAVRMSDEQWQTVLRVNLTAVFQITKFCLRTMIRKKWGRIVNISSVSGVLGNAGQANYAASKAGLESFTRSIAREVARKNITCNTVAPGFIETGLSDALTDAQRSAALERIPLGRMGSVEEVAHAVAFLMSEQGGYVTGACIPVNGGLVM